MPPEQYTSRFTNRYGEEWRFDYDSSKQEGFVSGSDAGWRKYRVVGGQAHGLILNNEEIEWLREVWSEATRSH